MLLHIASADLKDVFSEFLESQNIYADFADLETIPSFKAYFAGNKMLNNYQYIFFHFEKTPPCEDLMESINFIRRYFKVKIIIFAPKSHEVDGLFGALYEKGIREIIKTDRETDYLKELEECLRPDGKSFMHTSHVFTQGLAHHARVMLKPKLELPDGDTIKIALAGCQARVGTTTQAFAIFQAVESWGLTPVIVDRTQAVIKNLMKMYPDNCQEEQGVIRIQGIAFTHELLKNTEHNAYIFDCGVLDESSLQEFAECDVRFLCSGAKPWELPFLASALQDYPVDINAIMLSFASKREMESVAELLEGLPAASFTPWNTDIWQQENMDWYSSHVLPHIKDGITAGDKG